MLALGSVIRLAGIDNLVRRPLVSAQLAARLPLPACGRDGVDAALRM